MVCSCVWNALTTIKHSENVLERKNSKLLYYYFSLILIIEVKFYDWLAKKTKIVENIKIQPGMNYSIRTIVVINCDGTFIIKLFLKMIYFPYDFLMWY